MCSIRDFSDNLFLTVLMTKAPVDSLSEQLCDFKAVNESFLEFTKAIGDDQSLRNVYNKTALDVNDKDYVKKLFTNDFNFDPKLCWIVGKYLSDYLSTVLNRSRVDEIVLSVLSQPYETVANSSGMRGKSYENNFFTKKGFYVVYNDHESFDFNEVNEILSSDETPVVKRSKILSMNIKIYEKALKHVDDEMLFHMVHKLQRGGAREIYVMSFSTKIRQQIVERVLAKICKHVPNEVISVPANKRSQWVHTKMAKPLNVMKSNTEVFHTYDCRRWAPHSNLLKYFFFMSGLSSVFPPIFNKYFMKYWDSFYDKKFVVNDSLYEAAAKNKKYDDFTKLFTHHATDHKPAHAFGMKYSFMMGIHNYLSSLMHAATQMYISHIVTKLVEKNRLVNKNNIYSSEIDLYAHSDDSAGKSANKNYNSLVVTTAVHEILMKGCNQMLSKKKTCISTFYFEFLSTMYLGNTFVPLINKFASNISFNPSDEGYASDITSVISKVIEMQQFGATYYESYITMKTLVSAICYYYNVKISESNYNRPLDFLGVPDAHPLMYLLCGSNYDELRDMKLKPETWTLSMRLLSILNGLGWYDKLTPKFNFNNRLETEFEHLNECYKMLGINDDRVNLLTLLDKTTSVGLLLQFIALKKKIKFSWANEHQTRSRKMIRVKWLTKSNCISTTFGCVSYKQLNQMYDFCIVSSSAEKTGLSFEMRDALKNMMASEDIKRDIESLSDEMRKNLVGYDDVSILIELLDDTRLSNLREVPVVTNVRPHYLDITLGNTPFPKDITISSVILNMFLPKLSAFVKRGRDDSLTLALIEDNFPQIIKKSPGLLQKTLEIITHRQNRRAYFYSCTPRGVRLSKDYQGLAELLCYNSYHDTAIQGIILPLSSRLLITGGRDKNALHANNDIIISDLFYLATRVVGSKMKNIKLFKKLLIKNLNDKVVSTIEEMVARVNTTKIGLTNESLAICRHLNRLFVKSDVTDEIVAEEDFFNYGYYFQHERQQVRRGDVWYGIGITNYYWRDMVMQIHFDGNEISKIEVNHIREDVNDFMVYIDSQLIQESKPRLSYNVKYNIRDPNMTLLFFDNITKAWSVEKMSWGNMSLLLYVNTSLENIKSLVGLKNWSYDKINRLTILQQDSKSLKLHYRSDNLNMLKMDSIEVVNSNENKSILKLLGKQTPDIMTLLNPSGEYILPKKNLKDIILEPNATQIYNLLYNDEAEEMPRSPGDQGGLVHSMFKMKEVNDNYPFNPDMGSLSTSLKLSRYYVGVSLSTLYQQGESIIRSLSKNERYQLDDDIMAAVQKLKKLEDIKDVTREVVNKWGKPAAVKAMAIYNSSPKIHIDSLNYMIEKNTDISNASIYYSVLKSVLETILATRSFKSSIKNASDFEMRSAHVNSWYNNSNNSIKKSSVYIKSSNYNIKALMEFIMEDKRALKILNDELKNKKEDVVNTIVISKDSVKDFILMIYNLQSCLVKNDSIRELTPMGCWDRLFRDNEDFVKTLRIELIHFKERILKRKIKGIDSSTVEYPNLNLYNKMDGFKIMSKRDIIEMNASSDVGDSSLRVLINQFKLKRNLNSHDVIIQVTDDAYNAGSILNSAQSNKCISFCTKGLTYHARSRGQYKIGIIDPWLARSYGLGFQHVLVVYTIDKSNFHQRFGVVEINPEDYLGRDYSYSDYIREDVKDKIEKVLESVKIKKYTSLSPEEEKMMNLKDQVLELKLQTKEHQTSVNDTLSELISKVLDKNMLMLQRQIIDMPIEDINPEHLSLPYFWGTIKSEERSPKNRRICEDPILLSEMDSILPGLTELILSGRATISKEIHNTLKTTMRTLRSDKSPDNVRRNELATMINSILVEMIVTADGSSSLNKAMLRLSNECINSTLPPEEENKKAFKFKRKPVTMLDEI
jgi:hypothetical protein